jgi:hypothetical protein
VQACSEDQIALVLEQEQANEDLMVTVRKLALEMVPAKLALAMVPAPVPVVTVELVSEARQFLATVEPCHAVAVAMMGSLLHPVEVCL